MWAPAFQKGERKSNWAPFYFQVVPFPPCNNSAGDIEDFHVQSVTLPLINDSYKWPSELAASKYYLPFKLEKMNLTAESCNEF